MPNHTSVIDRHRGAKVSKRLAGDPLTLIALFQLRNTRKLLLFEYRAYSLHLFGYDV